MIDESALTKGQLRKLNALRRSLGQAIADEAFAKWLQQASEPPEVDENAEVIRDTLWSLIEEGRVSIRRGGYVVRRGRGRVIVEAPQAGFDNYRCPMLLSPPSEPVARVIRQSVTSWK